MSPFNVGSRVLTTMKNLYCIVFSLLLLLHFYLRHQFLENKKERAIPNTISHQIQIISGWIQVTKHHEPANIYRNTPSILDCMWLRSAEIRNNIAIRGYPVLYSLCTFHLLQHTCIFVRNRKTNTFAIPSSFTGLSFSFGTN